MSGVRSTLVIIGRISIAGAASLAVVLALAAPALGADTARLLVADSGLPGGGASRVLSFPAGTTGDTSPTVHLAGAHTGLAGASGVTRDAAGNVWVSNSQQNTITEYATAQNGDATPIRTIGGPDTALSTPRGLVFDAAGNLWVANQTSGNVTEYGAGASGDTQPLGIAPIGQMTDQLTNAPAPWGLAMDANGDLFVTDSANNAVVELAAVTAQDFAGVRVLKGTHTGLAGPEGVAIDSAGRILVANSTVATVVEFAPGATGDVAPIASLSGHNTLLTHPAGIGIDAAGNLWVTNPPTRRVSEFRLAPGANRGAPLVSFNGPKTLLTAPTGVLPVSGPGVATTPDPGVSQSSATLAATVIPDGSPTRVRFEWGPTASYGFSTSSGFVNSGPGPQTAAATVPAKPGTTFHYRAVATSDLGTVLGSDQTFTVVGDGLTHPRVSVSMAAVGGRPSRIAVYAPGSRGDVAPEFTIAGPHTQLVYPSALALDGHGHLFVAQQGEGNVLEFAAGAHGDAAPIATVTLRGTPFAPDSVALDADGHLLVGDANRSAPVMYRFALVDGQWTLDASITDAGAPTSVSNPAFTSAVAIGSDGRIIDGENPGSIAEWEVGANGSHRLLGRILGAQTRLKALSALSADATGSIIAGDVVAQGILTFAPGSVGDMAPVSTLSGPAARPFNGRVVFALDSSGGVVAGDASPPGLAEFAPGASGNAAPLVMIAGPLTDLTLITGVAVSPPPVKVATADLPFATTGTPYSTSLVAAGGFGPYTWSLADPKFLSGTGLTLSPDGVLSGTPTITGTRRIPITVTDQSIPAGPPLTVTLTLQIIAPVVPSIYVTDGAHGTLSDFALAADGDTPPLFVLGGANGLVGPAGVTVDPTGRVYATSSNTAAVAEFAPGSGLGAQPDRTISGSSTGLLSPTAVALDGSGGIYVSNPPKQSVTYYAPGASGDAAPRRTIAGPHTGIDDPESMTVNAAGDLWVVNTGNSTLTEYAPNADGDAAPIATVSSPAFLNGPAGIAQDESGHLLVTNQFNDAIDRFAPNADGTAPPLSVIQGADTGLNRPRGIDIDAQGRIVVSNSFGHAVTIYPADATDDTRPVQTIVGPSTGLGAPAALAVAPPLSLLTTRLPRATVGTFFSAPLRAALGTTPYRWRIARGRLPRGLRLTRAGTITGVPRVAERRRFRVEVTDRSRPQMRSSADLTLTTSCPRGRHGRSCTRGAIHTTLAQLRFVACRRHHRCIPIGRSMTLRVPGGHVQVELLRGRHVYSRATPTHRGRREFIELRLSHTLRRGTYTLQERVGKIRLRLPLRIDFPLFVL